MGAVGKRALAKVLRLVWGISAPKLEWELTGGGAWTARSPQLIARERVGGTSESRPGGMARSRTSGITRIPAPRLARSGMLFRAGTRPPAFAGGIDARHDTCVDVRDVEAARASELVKRAATPPPSPRLLRRWPALALGEPKHGRTRGYPAPHG